MDSSEDRRLSRDSYTAREAADALRLSERTIRRAIHHGDLAATKWGGVFRIPPGELARFGAERRGEAAPAVAPAALRRLLSRQRDSRTANILTPLTPLIGRSRDVVEVLGLLKTPGGPRLVVLTGPGGVGKTRLAISVAAMAREVFADGAIFISLAGRIRMVETAG
jgi:excisionase family DNA binding protein